MGRFETFGGVVVVEPVGQIPRAYVIRRDDHQIAILNNRATNAEVFCEYFCHSYTGLAPDREQVKRVTRIKVYGEGVIRVDPLSLHPAPPPTGVISVTADNVKHDTYIYSPLAALPTEGALWAQNCLALKGRVFDIKVQLVGVGLKIREVGFEYIVVN